MFALGLCGFSAPSWLSLLGTALVKQTPLQPADVIVVVSGGGVSRTDPAAELYARGYAERILVSGGTYRVLEDTVAASDLMIENLVAAGVPPAAILQESRAQSTWENAVFSQRALAADRPQSIILVTDDYHSRRTYYVFRKIFGPSTRIMSAPAPNGEFPIERWWTYEPGLITVQNEWFRLLWYMLRYRIVPLG